VPSSRWQQPHDKIDSCVPNKQSTRPRTRHRAAETPRCVARSWLICDDWAVDNMAAGAINLTGFVRATAGRRGSSVDLPGGVAIAGPVAVVNGYVDTAILTDPTMPPAAFFEAAISFFQSLSRTFIVWVPSTATSHLAEAAARSLVAIADPSPAMVVSEPGSGADGPRVQLATTEEALETFGDLCERGYQQPGMAWLLAHQQSYRAPGSFWHLAFDGDVPVSAACGFQTGDTGGIYSVATPPEFRGQGFAAAVTRTATNHLFDLGVERVVLQASKLGYGVYERLGFITYDHYERFAVPFTGPV
jgi:ribosomal protein S18 acetylase RimI-like enzyme